MKKYGNSFDDFSHYMEKLPSMAEVKKIPLSEWIDYFLWIGGSYSEIKNKISGKALDLSHGGYNNSERFFNPKKLDEPQQRSLLGHIAARVIGSNFIIKIGGDLIDSSIRGLSPDEKLKINDRYSQISRENPSIIVEGFKGEIRSRNSETINKSVKDYIPTKEDIERSVSFIQSSGGSIELEAVLDMVEKICIKQQKILKSNWRMITERNIEIWFK